MNYPYTEEAYCHWEIIVDRFMVLAAQRQFLITLTSCCRRFGTARVFSREWMLTDCNCHWGTCIAPPTRRPRVHHRVNTYPGAVNRMKRKCFQITTRRVRQSQQFQLRQPVPCSRCSNRKGSVANSSTCPRRDEVSRRWLHRRRIAVGQVQQLGALEI